MFLMAIIRCIMDIQFPGFDIFAPKIEVAWTALQQRYASRITDAELDYLLACLVFGLTSPAYADGDPLLHFEVCRALVGTRLPPDRADAALHTVPTLSQPWVESIREQLENQAAKMGRALQEMHDLNDDSAADAGPSEPGRPANSEEKAA